RGRGPGEPVVADPRVARDAAGPVRHRHGSAGERGAARRRSRPAPHGRGFRVRTRPGAQPDSPRDQRQSRRSHCRLALRPADRGCVKPLGIAHLEDPRLTSDLTVARDFDLGMTGPPLSMSLDFIAAGLASFLGGLISALVLAGFTWWAPLLLAGTWLATHWFLRESSVWRDRNTEEVRAAQRDSDYMYQLAVTPPAA